MQKKIEELIALTRAIVDYEGDVDEVFLELLADRSTKFQSIQTDLSKESNDLNLEKAKQERLQELYELTRKAEEKVANLKKIAKENIQKIETGKKSTSAYDKTRSKKSSFNKSYNVTPDAAFFDKKK